MKRSVACVAITLWGLVSTGSGDSSVSSCEVECVPGQGVCIQGSCFCREPYTGQDCSQTYEIPEETARGVTVRQKSESAGPLRSVQVNRTLSSESQEIFAVPLAVSNGYPAATDQSPAVTAPKEPESDSKGSRAFPAVVAAAKKPESDSQGSHGVPVIATHGMPALHSLTRSSSGRMMNRNSDGPPLTFPAPKPENEKAEKESDWVAPGPRGPDTCVREVTLMRLKFQEHVIEGLDPAEKRPKLPLRDAFKDFDRDMSGKLELPELRAALLKVHSVDGSSPNFKEDLRRFVLTILSALDRDKDEKLDVEELIWENICDVRIRMEKHIRRCDMVDWPFSDSETFICKPKFMLKFDQNEDGSLDVPEYFYALKKDEGAGEDEEEIFDVLDVDGNGKLDLVELHRFFGLPRFRDQLLIKMFGPPEENREFTQKYLGYGYMSPIEAGNWFFNQSDTNGDRRLSFSEFNGGAKMVDKTYGIGDTDRLFKELDRNGDKTLTTEELLPPKPFQRRTSGFCVNLPGFSASRCPAHVGPASCSPGMRCFCSPGYAANLGVCVPQQTWLEGVPYFDAYEARAMLAAAEEEYEGAVGVMNSVKLGVAAAAVLMVMKQMGATLIKMQGVSLVVFLVLAITYVGVALPFLLSAPPLDNIFPQGIFVIMLAQSVNFMGITMLVLLAPSDSELPVTFLGEIFQESIIKGGNWGEESGRERLFETQVWTIISMMCWGYMGWCLSCCVGVYFFPQPDFTNDEKLLLILMYLILCCLTGYAVADFLNSSMAGRAPAEAGPRGLSKHMKKEFESLTETISSKLVEPSTHAIKKMIKRFEILKEDMHEGPERHDLEEILNALYVIREKGKALKSALARTITAEDLKDDSQLSQDVVALINAWGSLLNELESKPALRNFKAVLPFNKELESLVQEFMAQIHEYYSTMEHFKQQVKRFQSMKKSLQLMGVLDTLAWKILHPILGILCVVLMCCWITPNVVSSFDTNFSGELDEHDKFGEWPHPILLLLDIINLLMIPFAKPHQKKLTGEESLVTKFLTYVQNVMSGTLVFVWAMVFMVVFVFILLPIYAMDVLKEWIEAKMGWTKKENVEAELLQDVQHAVEGPAKPAGDDIDKFINIIMPLLPYKEGDELDALKQKLREQDNQIQRSQSSSADVSSP